MTFTAIPANKLNAAINSTVKAVGKTSAQLHLVAYSCLALIESNGDVRPLQRLHDTIGGKVTKGAIASWSKTFGKVKVTEDEETGATRFAYAKAAKSDLEGAAACPVLDFKPEPKAGASEFDLAAKLATLLKQAEKAGAHIAPETMKAYLLLVEAENVLNGKNVVAVTDSKAGRAKNRAKAKAEQGELAIAS